MYIISQIFAIVAMTIDIIGKIQKNKRLILLFMIIACVFYILSYVFLKNPLAVTANIISLTRYIWYFQLNNKHKKFKDYIFPIVLINLVFIICFIFLAKSPIDVILIVSMLLLSIGLAFNNLNLIRVLFIFNFSIWGVYNYINLAYANLICDVLNIFLVSIALIHYNTHKKIKGEEQMKTIVLASGNKHKIKEIKEMFSQNKKTKDYKIIPMSEIGFEDDIEEKGETYEENARLKADAILQFLKKKNLDFYVLSDDSGLCVDSLHGAPGVYSARYAGEPVNYQANRDKLLFELKDKTNRNAHFVCCIILKDLEGKEIVVEGKTDGVILTQETGNKEFCYDCLFYSNDLKKPFSESTEEEKNSVSHRGRAVANLIEKL